MAALTSSSVAGPLTGTLAAPAAAALTDTIAAAQFGPNGLHLRVINGAGAPITVTVSDPGTTGIGNTSAGTAVSVTNATSKTIFIPKSAISPSTGLATITYSAITTITYELYRV